MIKQIKHFNSIYHQDIFPKNSKVYTIRESRIVKTWSEPELLEYFDLYDTTTSHPNMAEYSVGIFADNKNKYNIACVYKRGESSPVFTDKGMGSVHFKNKEFFKTYIATLINRAL